MAVAPDLLLNIKTPTAVAKAASASPKPAAQPSRDEPSSFANVYAKERQAKPAEAQHAAAKPARDKPVSDKPSQETDEAAGTQTPAAEETGKALPANGETEVDADGEAASGEEAELDPLLLFGLGGAPVAVDEEQPIESSPPGGELLSGLAQVPAMTGEADESETAPVGQQGIPGLQPAAQKSGAAALMPQEEISLDVEEGLPSEIVLGEKLAETSDEPSVEESFGDLLEGLSGPSESRAAAGEAAINRLNPLTQAITQQAQVQQAQRPTLVPGQPVQIQQSGWSEAVVDRVMWLSSQNLKSAEIQLDPAELGRMEVRIDMNNDQAQVTFVSQHAAVRDVLEGQMQRLRDMFTQQGMTMDVNVSDQSRGWRGEGSSDGHSRGGAGAGGSGSNDDEVVRGTMEISTGRAAGGRGLVDYYA
jgi:flagellar hook-length control protein FliK